VYPDFLSSLIVSAGATDISFHGLDEFGPGRKGLFVSPSINRYLEEHERTL
jgi:hypothetical protein